MVFGGKFCVCIQIYDGPKYVYHIMKLTMNISVQFLGFFKIASNSISYELQKNSLTWLLGHQVRDWGLILLHRLL